MIISRLAKLIGVDVATVAWVAAAVALVLAVLGTGFLVSTYDDALHETAIAKRERSAATTLATETAKTLEAERTARAAAQARDEAYEQLSQVREQARLDGARLSADLRRARERLQQLAAGNGGAAMPETGAAGDRCTDLRTALDRTTRALELYESEGDQAAGDGQRGVDVATIAAQAASEAEAAGR